MTAPVTLVFSGDQHEHLKSFLLPGDGKEAVAILLCGSRAGDRSHRLVVREIHGIPYEDCSERTPMRVTWPPDYIAPMLDRAAAEGLTVVKVHSHPGGYAAFSMTDDKGDERLLPMIRGWVETDVPHGSAVMLPDGQMFGRVLNANGAFDPIYCISVAGDDLHFWYADAGSIELPNFVASHAQAFDKGTIDRLRRLSFAVIGASGTGSPTIEQLMRLGAAVIVGVDDDHMEERNVNRILNSTMDDVKEKRPKVGVLADAVERTGLGTRFIPMKKNLWDPEVIREVAQCDIIFGCMDTVDGRYLRHRFLLFDSILRYRRAPGRDEGFRRRGSHSGSLRHRELPAPWAVQPCQPRSVHNERRCRRRSSP